MESVTVGWADRPADTPAFLVTFQDAAFMLSALLAKLADALRPSGCAYCLQPWNSCNNADLLALCPECKGRFGLREGHWPTSRNAHVAIHAATLFNGRVKQLLYGYKFYRRRDNVRPLAALLTSYWSQAVALKEVADAEPMTVAVLTIPARQGHPDRLASLGQAFRNAFGYHAEAGQLLWQRETQPQHTLQCRRERLSNLRGSLLYEPAPLKADASGPTMILILDDLTTTGATLTEAALAIRHGGFQGQIVGLAVCSIPYGLQRRLERSELADDEQPLTVTHP
jgi:predicted amidophosphoribosyltransferase